MSLPQPPAVEHCYRHPDRETGRRCTRCGKPACSDCLVQATVGSHCLDCARAARPDVKTKAKLWSSRQLAPVTMALIGINVLVYIWTVNANRDLVAGRIERGNYDLGLARVLVEQGEWYRLVSSGFLHFSIIHIGFNMLLLYQIGQLLERAVGSVRFGLLYFAALLGGSLGVMLLDSNGLTGGASGAVFGLMGAAAVGFHLRGINIFSTGIGTTLLLNLVFTFTINGISIGGHIGGLIAGAICGYVMLAPQWKGIPRWATYATPAGLAVLAVVASLVVAG